MAQETPSAVTPRPAMPQQRWPPAPPALLSHGQLTNWGHILAWPWSSPSPWRCSMPVVGSDPCVPWSALLPQGRIPQPGPVPLLEDPAQTPLGVPAAPNGKQKLHIFVTFQFGRQTYWRGGVSKAVNMKHLQLSDMKTVQKTNSGLAHLWQLCFAIVLHPHKSRFAVMPACRLRRMGSKS